MMSCAGYKMCGRIYLNGDGAGKGTHMSLFFVIMRSDYDALLPWPFTQKVTFTMPNQGNGADITDSFRPDPTSSSFKKPTSEMNSPYGIPMFAPVSMLDDPSKGFVQDDVLYIKIEVDEKGSPPGFYAISINDDY